MNKLNAAKIQISSNDMHWDEGLTDDVEDALTQSISVLHGTMLRVMWEVLLTVLDVPPAQSIRLHAMILTSTHEAIQKFIHNPDLCESVCGAVQQCFIDGTRPSLLDDTTKAALVQAARRNLAEGSRAGPE